MGHSWPKPLWENRRSHAVWQKPEANSPWKTASLRSLVAKRRNARSGLSRRRSRVRVPSLPPQNLPANSHFCCRDRHQKGLRWSNRWPNTRSQKPCKWGFRGHVCASVTQTRPGHGRCDLRLARPVAVWAAGDLHDTGQRARVPQDREESLLPERRPRIGTGPTPSRLTAQWLSRGRSAGYSLVWCASVSSIVRQPRRRRGVRVGSANT